MARLLSNFNVGMAFMIVAFLLLHQVEAQQTNSTQPSCEDNCTISYHNCINKAVDPSAYTACRLNREECVPSCQASCVNNCTICYDNCINNAVDPPAYTGCRINREQCVSGCQASCCKGCRNQGSPEWNACVKNCGGSCPVNPKFG